METLLHRHVRRGDVAAVATLLDAAANNGTLCTVVSALDWLDSTSLHAASGSDAITRLLLAGGADPNSADESQCTPLHRAALEGQADVLRSLLLFAANPTLRDDEGRTALDCALAAPHEECIALLRSAEEQQRALTQGAPARCDEDEAEEEESWCSSSDVAVAAAPMSPRHPSRHPSHCSSSASEVSQRSEAAEVPSAVDLDAAWPCSLVTGLDALPLALQPPHPPLRALSFRGCAYSPPCIALLCRERRAPQPASAPASPRRVGAMLGSMLRRVHVSDAADALPAREGKLHSVFGVSYRTRGWLDVHLPLLAWAADAETLYLSAPGRPPPGDATLLCSRLLLLLSPCPAEALVGAIAAAVARSAPGCADAWSAACAAAAAHCRCASEVVAARRLTAAAGRDSVALHAAQAAQAEAQRGAAHSQGDYRAAAEALLRRNAAQTLLASTAAGLGSHARAAQEAAADAARCNSLALAALASAGSTLQEAYELASRRAAWQAELQRYEQAATAQEEAVRHAQLKEQLGSLGALLEELQGQTYDAGQDLQVLLGSWREELTSGNAGVAAALNGL